MTGEVTLTGRVLPIGGLREKTMAAYSAGVRTVLIPKANLGDLDDIDPEARAALRFIPVSNVKEVLGEALRAPVAEKPAEVKPGEPIVIIPAIGGQNIQGVNANGA